MSFIEESLYKEIIKSVPIICIDLVVRIKDEFLLIKRNENPLKGEWWVPGGRINMNETIEQSFKTKLFKEVGLSYDDNVPIIGIYEDFFQNSSKGTHEYHTVSIVGEIKLPDLPQISIDKTSNDWRLFKDLPLRFKNKLRSVE